MRVSTFDKQGVTDGAECGKPRGAFADRHGDRGRDPALHPARMKSGLALRRIGEIAGGMDYKAVGKAIGRFKASLDHVPARRRLVKRCLNDLPNVETLMKSTAKTWPGGFGNGGLF